MSIWHIFNWNRVAGHTINLSSPKFFLRGVTNLTNSAHGTELDGNRKMFMENQITEGYGHAPIQTNILIIKLSNDVIRFIKLLSFWLKTHEVTNDGQGAESDGNRNRVS